MRSSAWRALGRAAALLVLTACTDRHAPAQLLDARDAYRSALAMPGSSLAHDELERARLSLNDAETALEREGAESARMKDLAYLAHRRALVAQARAEELVALEERRRAIAALERWRETQPQSTTHSDRRGPLP